MISKTQTKPNTEKIILGIDPGTNVMGYGVIRVMGNTAELVVMGVIDMRKEKDPYLRLGKIFERVTGIIDSYLPDEMAIEAPFFGKNVQSMLKLGRAQGVAIAAAIHHDVPIHEYAPLKIKMAITGQGQASKMGRPETGAKHYSSWKDFAQKNQGRIGGGNGMTGPQAKLLAAINRTTHK